MKGERKTDSINGLSEYFDEEVIKGVKIGGIKVDPPLFLAPLAGYTFEPFRRMCGEKGVEMTFTPMTSIEGLFRNNIRSHRYCCVSGSEKHVGIQLFGSEPEHVDKAVSELTGYDPDAVDINMGCPKRKVVSTGAGAGLMKDPDLAVKMTERAISASPVPVTVKMRTGPDDDHRNAPELAKRCAKAGAEMITVHGRSLEAGFSGDPDLSCIRSVVSRINDTDETESVPIIGNGDINSGYRCLKMIAETGVDGVMVGRCAVSDIYSLKDIRKALESPSEYLENHIEKKGSTDIETVIKDMTKLAREFEQHFEGLRSRDIVPKDRDTREMSAKVMRKFLLGSDIIKQRCKIIERKERTHKEIKKDGMRRRITKIKDIEDIKGFLSLL